MHCKICMHYSFDKVTPPCKKVRSKKNVSASSNFKVNFVLMNWIYTNSLANADSFYANFTNTTFQKISQIQSPALKDSCVHFSLDKAQNDLFWFLVSGFFIKKLFLFFRRSGWEGTQQNKWSLRFLWPKIGLFSEEVFAWKLSARSKVLHWTTLTPWLTWIRFTWISLSNITFQKVPIPYLTRTQY